MSTPLTDRIEALTAQANATTGASDATLTDAVGRLCEGYGSSGIVTAELLQTYKVLTSWENSTDGNAPAILTAMGYVYNALSANEAYLCVIRGNVASDVTYRGDMIYMANSLSSGGSNNGYIIRNNKRMATAAGKNYYFFVSEGAEIDVYKLTYNLP